MKKSKIIEKDIFGILGKMEVVRKMSKESMEQHYRNPDEGVIPLSTFKGLEVGDRIELDETGRNYGELVCVALNKIVVIVINEKGFTVPKHKHDFREDLRIIKGKLLETVSGKIYIEDEDIVIRPFELHGISAQEYSIYTAVINITRDKINEFKQKAANV